MQEQKNSIDIDSYWQYSAPGVSELRFREMLPLTEGDERLELLTQITRTYSLRGRFDEAHELLDEVEEQLEGAGRRPQLRYLLERGRTFNSSGDKEKARKLFTEAWEIGVATRQEGLAVDAAHMVAITYSGGPGGIMWNERGLDIARVSDDPKAQSLVPAMLNNMAWDLSDMIRFDEALPVFQEAHREWTKRGKPQQIQIAKWSVARCLRALERYDEALAIQRELEAEHEAAGTIDGYVFEELGENLAAMGRERHARPYFAGAYNELKKDDWLVKNEADRLESLRQRAS